MVSVVITLCFRTASQELLYGSNLTFILKFCFLKQAVQLIDQHAKGQKEKEVPTDTQPQFELIRDTDIDRRRREREEREMREQEERERQRIGRGGKTAS